MGWKVKRVTPLSSARPAGGLPLGDGTWLPEDDQRRIVHAAVRACRASVQEAEAHHRMCGIYANTLWTYLRQHVHAGYWIQAGYVQFGTGDPTSTETAGVMPHYNYASDSRGTPYHAWVMRQHTNQRWEMIDITLGFWRHWAEAVGFTWTREGFPPYLWTWADEVSLGDGWDARY